MKPSAASWLRAAVLLLLLLSAGAASASRLEVSRYTPLFAAARDGKGEELILLRSFFSSDSLHYLAVNPRTLATRLLAADGLVLLGQPDGRLQQTPYLRGVARSSAAPFPLQNDGLTRSDSASGVFLTVDLCPSARTFERELFSVLTPQEGETGAVPVAVAISGRWLRSHQEEFRWLRQQEAEGKLAVTWVNHSLTHPYDPSLPLERNFLLSAGTELELEILEAERLLLQEGVVPSVFFRFPGLVSDRHAMEETARLGLIVLGSDAWLAKGEQPRQGSFILVHGNGNEPGGVKRFFERYRGGSLPALRPLAEALLP